RGATTQTTSSTRTTRSRPRWPRRSASRMNSAERRRVAPGSHGDAKRDQTRLSATSTNPLHDAGSGMGRPPPHVHGKEGVDGSSPSEGLQIPAIERFVLSVLKCG